MIPARRVYLDNAATSWPKPQSVYDAVDDYHHRLGVSVGRGGYAEAEEVGRVVNETRAAIARLIDAESSERIVFTLNGTDSLNMAIHGILKPGEHVVTTVVEHNSVLRPLRSLEKRRGIDITRVRCNEFGIISPEDIRAALRTNTRLIVLTHASNVTGAIQPVAEIGKVAREHGVLFLVDAAQTLGHAPVSVSAIGVDILAAPGHKGLLGPLGTGILYIRPGVEELIDCVRQGGTGSASSSEDQPEAMPEKYESGSQNVPGIVGLRAGIEYIEQRGLADIRQHSIDLIDRLTLGLKNVPGVKVYGPRTSVDRVGVVSITFSDQVAPSFAKRLEEEFRVQVRGGFQCAALMHRSLGTFEQQGTVRFSVGPFNTVEDIDAAIEATRTIAGSQGTVAQSVTCPCVAAVREKDQTAPVASLVVPAIAENTSVATPSRTGTNVADIPGLRELWDETLGDTRVCIAILDGPVELSHPCFQGADIAVHPSSAASPNKGAATQHGTHVASVIFGQHHSDVKGIAPNCHGVIIPVFRDGKNGEVIPCSQIDLARAITLAVQYAEERGAKALLINISGGQFSPSGEAHPLLSDVVNSLNTDLHLVVSAAGNQGCDCLHIPGAMPTVLAVGAMSRDGDPLAFSNWGKAYRAQGILAIGEDVQGASVDYKAEFRTGTSYATPIVTGVAALLLSDQLKRTGYASVENVRSALLDSAVDCEQIPITDCRRLLAGRLDLRSALSTLFNQGTNNMTDDRQLASPAAEQVTAQTHEPDAATAPRPPEARHEVRAARIATPSSAGSGWSVDGSLIASNTVLPAGCGCGGSGNGASMQKVYAIGRLTYDFGSRQRMDYFRNQLGGRISDAELIKRVAEQDSAQTYSILEQKGKQFPSRPDLSYLTWVLQIDATPVYALSPAGAFAVDIHDTFVQFLRDQLPVKTSRKEKSVEAKQKENTEDTLYGEGVERMAVGGVVNGEVRLYTGEVVPKLEVDYRTLANWTTRALAEAVAAFGTADPNQRVEEILDHLYESTRNLGIQSADRALNFAATMGVTLLNGLGDPQSSTVLKDMILDYVDVQPSPICRPDSDCWDVAFTFFDPNDDRRARRGFRYTIDVTDTLPTQLPGTLRPFIVGSRR